ncbi:hypothetical protein GA0061102_102833 [Rhizobium miluonense]|uniref:Glucosamine inositolphosphorylceramide transferase 1 N-terminal domain-containing protein n=2 Tax=Rhizobium miluonense TaxID=411945 RepID=A0A1C3WEJ3_9HYPH|nr:hypothetical protein GA0061102_102833 [Rhizobium miluonense]
MSLNEVKGAAAMNKTKPLRVGVLIARARALENWELMILDRIIAAPWLELAAVFTHSHAFGEGKVSKLLSWGARLEASALARQPAYCPKHFDSRHHFIDIYDADSHKTCTADNITAASLRRLKLDLVIRMIPKSMADDAIAALPFGEWAFNLSDQRSADMAWFGYAEVLARASTADLVLYAKCGSEADRLEIARAAFNIKPSAARLSAFVRERSVTLLLRELARLADNRRFTPSAFVDPVGAHAPSLGNLLRYGSIVAGSISRKAFRSVTTKLRASPAIWTLYTGRGHIGDFDPSSAVEIPPAGNSIKADPFLFQHQGQCYLFYEAYSRSDRKAHIAVGRFDGNALIQVGVALERPYHLSYPFIFRDGDEIFMIPETHHARRLEVWRCCEFPLKWELHATAFEGQSPADSVLIRHGGKWWLFTNLSDFHAYEDHCSELYLFEVDGPALKDIKPHKRNPVVIGSTDARGAGRIFEHEGRLLRPSQNNTHGIYGYGLNIMEIEKLTVDDYRERRIRTITPSFKAGLHGCHHFDATDGRYILDARLTN